MGRRAHRPDPTNRRQVEAMAGYGIPEADIACVLDIDPKTLRKHYRSELDKGHIKSTAKVAENLYRKATGEGREAVIAAIFWLKTRAGWKETNVHELNGAVSIEVITGVVRDGDADGRVGPLIEHRPLERASGVATPRRGID